MGILKIGLKAVGSAALGAAGVASALARNAANLVGADEIADVIGKAQDKSFNTIEDMWTSDEEKDEAYYFRQAEKSMGRAVHSQRSAEEFRKKYEKAKAAGEAKKK